MPSSCNDCLPGCGSVVEGHRRVNWARSECATFFGAAGLVPQRLLGRRNNIRSQGGGLQDTKVQECLEKSLLDEWSESPDELDGPG
jgi:hypothetical protein